MVMSANVAIEISVMTIPVEQIQDVLSNAISISVFVKMTMSQMIATTVTEYSTVATAIDVTMSSVRTMQSVAMENVIVLTCSTKDQTDHVSRWLTSARRGLTTATS